MRTEADMEYERIDRYRRDALTDIQREHQRLIADPSRIKMVVQRGPSGDVVLPVLDVLVGPAGTIVYVG